MNRKPDSGTAVWFGPAGWSYPDWKGLVYPRGMKVHPVNYLEKYFNLIEINTTFYHVPAMRMVESWCGLPSDPGFQFAVKMGRMITHEKEEPGEKESQDGGCRRKDRKVHIISPTTSSTQ